eukprot:GHUV01035769.1.p1 GENE.GHUV01035769.1~~GHUV01035769.1.p1  ORF type:complete len:234 (+),score=41.24 GHUV01035769.1:146-847(+)
MTKQALLLEPISSVHVGIMARLCACTVLLLHPVMVWQPTSYHIPPSWARLSPACLPPSKQYYQYLLLYCFCCRTVYVFQVAGVVEVPRSSRPLILLNDKRYHDSSSGTGPLKDDRRMILEIEKLAQDIAAAYPSADVVVARFRDLPWPDQVRLLCQASVFITTQGSSAFRWLWLPPGATTVVIGAPEGTEPTEWKSFHELDRWFSLSYVRFQRYHIDTNGGSSYPPCPSRTEF